MVPQSQNGGSVGASSAQLSRAGADRAIAGGRSSLAATAQQAPRWLAGAVPSILSGLICGLVIFVFCCVFSGMIFQVSPLIESAMPLGVGMHTVSTLVGSLVFAKLSGCKAVIAGPDINPAIFIAEATSAIVEAILSLSLYKYILFAIWLIHTFIYKLYQKLRY